MTKDQSTPPAEAVSSSTAEMPKDAMIAAGEVEYERHCEKCGAPMLRFGEGDRVLWQHLRPNGIVVADNCEGEPDHGEEMFPAHVAIEAGLEPVPGIFEDLCAISGFDPADIHEAHERDRLARLAEDVRNGRRVPFN